MGGFSTITGDEFGSVMNADNASFDGTIRDGVLSTDGQLWIGSTALNAGQTHINVGSLTSPGGTITIGYSSPNITLDAASGPGTFTWSDTSGTVTATAFNGYFITATCTSTLPASPSEGDTISYCVDTTDILTITANTGQKIRLGTSLSISAGTCANTARGDSITLVYRATGSTWFSVPGPQGNWNVQTS